MRNKFDKSRDDYFKVSLIEDSEIHKEWLKAELAGNEKIKIEGIDRLGRDGIKSIKTYEPDMVLLDFQLEDMTGLEISKRIKNYKLGIKIFLLTAHNEISIIERIIDDKNIDAIAIKGSRYFSANFLTTIMHVLEGGAYIDPSLLKNLRQSKDSGLSQLTRREFEIFIQTSSGKADHQIAADLCVELSHVRNLKSRIASKIKDRNVDNLISKIVKNSHPDLPVFS